MSAEKSVEKLVNVQRFEPYELAADHSVSDQVVLNELCAIFGVAPTPAQRKEIQASLEKTILSGFNIGYERGYTLGFERGFNTGYKRGLPKERT